MTATRASVIVPAHNEETVLPRGLAAMLDGAAPGEFEVLVVSNGCSDRTAERAREFGRESGYPVSVLELAEASKVAAMRAGARRATGAVRVYVDADVVLAAEVLRALVEALLAAGDRPAVGYPAMRMDTVGCAPLVRAYYRAWTELPYARTGPGGSGVFGLTAAGSQRLGEFPAVLNDDGWVRQAFAPGERLTAPGSVTVRAPRTLAALVRRRARIAIGNRDLARMPGTRAAGTARPAPDADGNGLPDLARAVRERRLGWPEVAAYLLVTALARGLATWRRLLGSRDAWSTDRTSRTQSNTQSRES
jgi:glycosyltransferase involved in cell wall biosynthesis